MSALVTLKVDDDEKALWVESARYAGVSLSEWIRRRCQGKAVTPTMGAVVTLTDDEIGNPVSDAELVKRIKKYTRPIERAVERAFTPDFKQGKKK